MKFAIPTVATLAGAALLVACAPESQATTGAADYARFCASCHGPSGKGDGPLAAGLTPRPADLTGLSRRHGGSFPRLQVMGRINGYTMGSSDSHMPQFGELLENGT
ncbi:MAG TPA: c-type cytochrome, partial [Paracoccus sp. (in: a-proteobacteria)]|nr:c-type cytochrome [Paracoccus sp. (in: a-proteobacteria)]